VGLESFGPVKVNNSKQVVTKMVEPSQLVRAQPSKKTVEDLCPISMDQDERALNKKKSPPSPK
jgi:hypothetical protein